MADQVLLRDTVGAVARCAINRPDAMNALNTEVVEALDAAIAEVASDPAIRCFVIGATGGVFCAGADLKDALQTSPEPGKTDFLDQASAMMNRLRQIPKPVIVALNGTTMAGGLELAMCADIILAAEDARIADAHANFGVYPGAGGAAILPRMIPHQMALYMLLSGRSLTARRLYDLGFIAELHPSEALDAAAMALATEIAAKSPIALARMKEVARGAADKTAADALLHEQVMLRQHMRSVDLQEGLSAFVEKRRPRFTGR
jgi:enoyl-CoA hydratase/carnithine racemase